MMKIDKLVHAMAKMEAKFSKLGVSSVARNAHPKQEPKAQKDTWTCTHCEAERCFATRVVCCKFEAGVSDDVAVCCEGMPPEKPLCQGVMPLVVSGARVRQRGASMALLATFRSRPLYQGLFPLAACATITCRRCRIARGLCSQPLCQGEVPLVACVTTTRRSSRRVRSFR